MQGKWSCYTMFQSNKKDQISPVTWQYFGRTPNDQTSESKKLLVLISKRSLISGAILCSVINRPENKSFLVATSDSFEFRPESFNSKGPGANSGT